MIDQVDVGQGLRGDGLRQAGLLRVSLFTCSAVVRFTAGFCCVSFAGFSARWQKYRRNLDKTCNQNTNKTGGANAVICCSPSALPNILKLQFSRSQKSLGASSANHKRSVLRLHEPQVNLTKSTSTRNCPPLRPHNVERRAAAVRASEESQHCLSCMFLPVFLFR